MNELSVEFFDRTSLVQYVHTDSEQELLELELHAPQGPPGPPGPGGGGAWAVGVQPLEPPDGARTNFSTSHQFVPGSTSVSVCGLNLIRGEHFAELSQGAITTTLGSPLLPTDSIILSYQIQE